MSAIGVQNIIREVRGRGIGNYYLPPNECICHRKYSTILCCNCGLTMYGRVRYLCIKHPMTTFLMDITNCPRCKAYEFMLQEVPHERKSLDTKFSD